MATRKKSNGYNKLWTIAVVIVFFSFQCYAQSIEIKNLPERGYYQPLELVEIELIGNKKAELMVFDGNGQLYYRAQNTNSHHTFPIGGALGNQTVILKDTKGKVKERVTFQVDGRTEIADKKGKYNDMLDMLYFSMTARHTTIPVRYDGATHHLFSGWFQDHVHVMKAMKYFYPDVTSGIDVYAMGQRQDGMIYDNHYHSYGQWKNWMNRFGPDFVKVPGPPEDFSSFFVRIPAENMSEFTFLESVYYAWKATGNDEWMKSRLDNCLKAVAYSTSDPYRWSEKFQLLKRPYTIDIWDFQPPKEVAVFGGDEMMAHPDITKFNILYADNIGMAIGCEYLSEMLEYAGRQEEAQNILQLGKELRQRTDSVCWNGSFYRHHVPEDPSYFPDFGNTPVDKQVTISNSYCLNRRVGHEKAVKIIETYQKIAKEMPESSAGEWYMCFPPFESGWGHRPKWEYMNGGTSSIVAGEVAHGAFQHGYESYGVYILDKMMEWASWSGNQLKCIYRGAMPDMPERSFTPIDFTSIANADISGTNGKDVPGFTGEGDNDLHNFPVGRQKFKGIPFTVVDPKENKRRACLIMSNQGPYSKEKSLALNQKAASIYLLHAQSGPQMSGSLRFQYADGTNHTEYILKGKNVNNWWYPQQPKYNKGNYPYHLVWEGKNAKSISVGVFLYGLNNPYPDKEIKEIQFNASENGARWIILGATLSDHPVFFMPPKFSFGAPGSWGAAAVTYALLEGLAGVKDEGVAYNKASLSPRWIVTDVDSVKVLVKYEASSGYMAYKYEEIESELRLQFTGSALYTDVKILLPENKRIQAIELDGKSVDGDIIEIEQSRYLKLNSVGSGVHNLKLLYE